MDASWSGNLTYPIEVHVGLNVERERGHPRHRVVARGRRVAMCGLLVARPWQAYREVFLFPLEIFCPAVVVTMGSVAVLLILALEKLPKEIQAASKFPLVRRFLQIQGPYPYK